MTNEASAIKSATASQWGCEMKTAVSLTERLIQAAVDYEAGRCGRQELFEARAAVEAAIQPGLLSSDNPFSRRDEIEKWLAWDTAWHQLAHAVSKQSTPPNPGEST